MIDETALSSKAFCNRLSDAVLATLRPLAEDRSTYGLLDFPNHGNIGDSAIWAGEIALLGKIHGLGPSYTSHMRYPAAEPSRILAQEAILYLHGGGNFGDIWPVFQTYREEVISANPRHRIVQLPQTIHFAKPEAIERTRRVIGTHRDFHLMVRDEESLELARQKFDCSTYLVPDGAFGIDISGIRRNTSANGTLALLREDKEVRPDAIVGRSHFQDAVIADWNQKNRRLVEKGLVGLFMALPFRAAQALRTRAFNAMVNSRVAIGFAQLDQAKVIVTDRLHGHIMATLLGKPHIVVDNNYGKISRFIRAFGKDDITLQARDYREARELMDLLQASTPADATLHERS